VVFWSVTIIVTVTCVWLVMRADNDGGGGIIALITLITARPGAVGPRAHPCNVRLSGCCQTRGRGPYKRPLAPVGARTYSVQ
jgi:hypothetical protein